MRYVKVLVVIIPDYDLIDLLLRKLKVQIYARSKLFPLDNVSVIFENYSGIDLIFA